MLFSLSAIKVPVFFFAVVEVPVLPWLTSDDGGLSHLAGWCLPVSLPLSYFPFPFHLHPSDRGLCTLCY